MQKARINEKEKPQHCPPFLYEIGNKLVTDVSEVTVLSHFQV